MPPVMPPVAAEAAAPEPEPTADQLMAAATERLAALEAERDDYRDRWVRSEAEMQNARARARREVEETRQYAVQKFARDVVEAAENLKRGIDSIPAATPDEPPIVGTIRDGLDGTYRSFLSLLSRNGIEADDPTGKPFDPNLHQAMSEQETAEHTPGTVVQAWTTAWTLNGRLLRPAMVVVARQTSDPDAARAAAVEAMPSDENPEPAAGDT